MSNVMRRSARRTSVVAATLLILSFGTVGAAFADPGNGNGAGQDGSSAVGAGNGNANGAGNGNANGADNGNGNANGADNGNGNGASSQAATVTTSSQGSSATGSSSAGPSSKGSAKSSSSHASTKASSSNGKAADHKTTGTAGTSGDPKKPQPISGADDNSGGANGQCPAGVYCSTRDGSPSMNGQGKGKAVGKPCAGCVGKADNKNPQGQKPGPSDRNAGYECDRNNGIGKTNPAHTGCKSTPPPPPACVPSAANNYCQPPPGCVPSAANNYCQPPPGCVPSAANNYCQPPPECVPAPGEDENCVKGEEELLCPDGSVMPANGKCEEEKPPTVLGEEAFRPQPNAAVSQPQAGVLPATGASSGLGLLTGAGFMMLATGAVAMLRRRSA